MKEKWFNLVLRLTNQIYRSKQAILTQSGLRVVWLVFQMIILELVLGIISFPLYLVLKSKKVTTFLSEKGTYEKVAFDYNLRRILTLTGVGIVALIWAIKILLMFLLPVVYGPLQLFSIADFRPADMSSDVIATEAGVQTARVVKNMAPPKLDGINKQSNGDYTFFGQGQPGMGVVVLLSDLQTVVYTSDVDKNGNWQISHSQKAFKLSEGNHSVIVFNHDKDKGLRSEAAPEQFFKVTTTWWDALSRNIDILANLSIMVVIALGLFLMLLTI